MCGIFGVINKSVPLDKQVVLSGLNKIAHRGPDDEGTYFDNRVAFTHKRLSIVDVSACGHQPMVSQNGNFILIFNGEIYNHLEIREDLCKAGYTFKGTSDTETLLYGFEHFGTALLNKLNGIFAFAIYDKTSQQIFIARDHFGIKPLYYLHSPDLFTFASEIKALINVDSASKGIDYTALVDYLNFLWAPGEKTPFENVKKLLPGYYLIYDIGSNSFETKCYYDVPFTGNYRKKSEKELVDELEEKLLAAVERQLMSDVPLGFFVSGGIDSSLIAAMAKDIKGAQAIEAFTIDSGDDLKKEGFSNDLHYAKLISKKLGFDLNVVNSKVDILQDFDKMIWHLEEPQADPAPLSVYNICKVARQNGIKVLLGGTGADDIFSGYRRHQALSYQKYIGFIPTFFREGLQKRIQSLNANNPFNRRVKKLFKDIGKSETDRMIGYFSWLPLEVNKGLFAPGLRHRLSDYNPGDYLKGILNNIPLETNSLNKLLYLEIKSFLVDHNLNYTDKMSMAAGVEVRVPYLDVDLVNFTTQIPPHFKMKGIDTKYLLKKVAEKYLPAEIINRSKAGFGAPVRKWIINDMDEMIHERLSPSRIKSRGIFNSDAVQQLICNNKAGKIDASYTVWSLLAIESWMMQFVDGAHLF